MNKLKESGLTIGDFASMLVEQDLKDVKAGRKKLDTPSKTLNTNNQVDISEIKVDESFTNTILSKSFGLKVKKPKEIIQENKSRPQEEIIKEFIDLVKRGKELIHEMTTCGSLGVNMAGKHKETTKSKQIKADPFMLKKNDLLGKIKKKYKLTR